MTNANNFEMVADEGFYQTIEPSTARRQFNMSLGLVAVLAAVAMAVGVSAGFSPIQPTSPINRQARLTVQAPQAVHVMQAQVSQPRNYSQD